MRLRPVILVLIGCFLSAPASAERAAQRFDDLGDHRRSITTGSAEAQEWFDQGVALYFNFNHEEAILSFEAAADADPGCAMAWFAIGLSAGPNINNPEMEEEMAKLAFDASQHALTLLDDESPVERALVEALAQRYAWPRPDDLTGLNQAWADAMLEVYEQHPDDADVGAWTAEALMNLRPWDLWTSEGEPQPGTLRIVEILEDTLDRAPLHPGANHFYIHTMEASPYPERALDAANTLRDLVPAAGHLVHMPGHIDIRLGNYEAAIQANRKAIQADLAYAAATQNAPGFYTIYRAHNYHFLAYAAMFDGQRELALEAARNMIGQVPMELVLAYPDFLDCFMAVPIHVHVRFGLWEDLLEIPEPREELLANRAFWHYGRTVALSSLGRVEEARSEFAALEAAIEAVPDTRLMGNNDALLLLEIGRRMAEGELRYREGAYDTAFALLREGVELDDALRYDEPWGWMQPVRHALGALLLEQNRLAEAEAVYRADLALHPDNGWALHGLEEALRRQGKAADASKCGKDFQRAWSRSDITLKASCFCANKARGG
jgi:tetratricopeptide (TPR) repeat protein